MKNYIKINANLFFFIISLLFTVFFVGVDNISPFKTDWLFSQMDLVTHYTGWCFFKNDIWRFPIGLNPNYGTINNSIIFSDSIPILAFLFKLITFSFVQEFNYFTIWIFICFFFQGLLGYKIIYRATKHNFYSLISALFFMLSPILLHKMTHAISLGSHFLILGSIYLIENRDKKKIYYWYLISLISILVHFYIFVIISIIFLFDLLNNFFKEKNLIKIIYISITYLFFSVITMYVSGYFTINSINALAVGYGELKFNLLGFFDPVQLNNNSDKSITGFSSWSLFLKDLPSYPGEYDGFAYLGLGIIFLLLFSIYKSIQNKKLNHFNFLNHFKNIYVLIFLFFFIFSLSNNIDFGFTKIIHIEVNKYLLAILGVVRSTGRFIWPAYYLLMIFVIFYLFKKNSIKKSLIILNLALIIQTIDILPGISQIFNGKYFSDNKKILFKEITPLKDPIWQDLKNENYISTTYEANYNNLVNKMAKYLCENNIKSNIYYLARYDRFRVPQNRYLNYKDIVYKNLKDTPYIISDYYNHILDISDRYKNDDVGFFYRDNIWIIQKNKKNLMSQNDFKYKNKLNFPSFDEKNSITVTNKDFFGVGWFIDTNYPDLIISDGYVSSILFKTNYLKKSKIIFDIDEKKINQNEIDFDIYINDKFVKNQKIIKNETSKFELNLKNLDTNNVRIDFYFKELNSQWDTRKNINSNKFGIYLKSILMQNS